MAVPGTPSLIVRKRSASELPCFFCVRVRSGPRPPPRAPRPWQKAQLERNWYSPSFASFASPAYGFFSCASNLNPPAERSARTITPAAITGLFCLSRRSFKKLSRLDANMFSVTLLALQISHLTAISYHERPNLGFPQLYHPSPPANLRCRCIGAPHHIQSPRRNR